MTPDKIALLITRRNKLTARRDGLIDSKRIAAIDAQLEQVPAGVDNDVDLALGRSCAVLPKRVVLAQHIDGTIEIDPPPGWFVNPAAGPLDEAQVVADEMYFRYMASLHDARGHGCAGNDAETCEAGGWG